MLYFRKLFLYLINRIPSNWVFNFYFSHFNSSNYGMVLALHRVTNSSTTQKENSLNSFIEISGKNLEKTILNLKYLNVQFVSLNELSDALTLNTRPSQPIVHFSFDDGYADNFTIAFPILKKHGIPFSIFIVSEFIENKTPFLWWYMIEAIINHQFNVSFEKYNYSINDSDYQLKNKAIIFEEFRSFILQHLDKEKRYLETRINDLFNEIPDSNLPEMLTWKQLKILHESGLCEIGIHTRHHVRFRNLMPEEKEKEIMECKEAINLNTGIVSKYFSYPYGSSEDIGKTDDLQKLMMSCGIKAAFTTISGELNGNCNPFFLPRLFVNNSANQYTLQSRLNGTYQRTELHKHLDFKK